MRRPLVWSLVALLLGSWLTGIAPAPPLAAAGPGAMETIRYDADSFVYLYRDTVPVETYVAPPPQSAYVRAQSATFSIQYVGFPAEAQAAFEAAVAIWQGLIATPVPISVVAYWRPLAEKQLGGAMPVNAFSNFANAPQRDTYYPSALANALAGTDLAPNEPDIAAEFNSTLTDWYFGTAQTPSDRVNFVSTVVHELAHGLGFAGSARVVSGQGQWGSRGLPRVYDRFVVNGDGVSILDTAQFPNPSAALGQQLQSNNLFWSGGGGAGANGGNRPKLFAPAVWEQGSSYGHLDERTYPPGTLNSLMTPALAPGESVYDPGPIALGMLADMGWPVVTSPACFAETGKCIKGRFAQYWRANGGLAQQGFPLTDEFVETNPTDGKPYLTQYFERARFEYHPENTAPYDVLLGLLGREQLARYHGNLPPAMPGSPLGTDCATFAQTGKQACGAFLAYWRANGGLAQQGLPLTDLFLETNPTDGKQYPTQYFERARFEYHAENAGTPYEVLLGLLGREQFLVRYPNGAPASPSASPSPKPSSLPSASPTASPFPTGSPSASPGGAWGPTLAPLAGGSVYADPGGHFTISIPGNWEILATDTRLVVFGLVSPPVECGAATEAVTASTTLATLDQAVENANASLANYRQIAKDQVLVRGQPAYRRVIAYTHTDGSPTQEEQVYFVTGGGMALVLCTALQSQFAGYAATFDGIAGSMKLPTMAVVTAQRATATAAAPAALRTALAATFGAARTLP